MGIAIATTATGSTAAAATAATAATTSAFGFTISATTSAAGATATTCVVRGVGVVTNILQRNFIAVVNFGTTVASHSTAATAHPC
jgi:hypothetical protein